MAASVAEQTTGPHLTVIAFCKAWERREIDTVLAMLSPTIIYENVPRHTMRGRYEAERFIRPIISETTSIEIHLTAIATADDGRTVLTERIDLLHYPKGIVTLPLMGTFVVINGLITEWRDYTDGASAGAAFQAVGAVMVLPDAS